MTAAEDKLQLKAYGWQASHIGSPHNEWVDRMVAHYAQGYKEPQASMLPATVGPAPHARCVALVEAI